MFTFSVSSCWISSALCPALLQPHFPNYWKSVWHCICMFIHIWIRWSLLSNLLGQQVFIMLSALAGCDSSLCFNTCSLSMWPTTHLTIEGKKNNQYNAITKVLFSQFIVQLFLFFLIGNVFWGGRVQMRHFCPLSHCCASISNIYKLYLMLILDSFDETASGKSVIRKLSKWSRKSIWFCVCVCRWGSPGWRGAR